MAELEKVESPEELAARYHLEKSRRGLRAVALSSAGAALFTFATVIAHRVQGTWTVFDWVYGACGLFFVWSAVGAWRFSKRDYRLLAKARVEELLRNRQPR